MFEYASNPKKLYYYFEIINVARFLGNVNSATSSRQGERYDVLIVGIIEGAGRE